MTPTGYPGHRENRENGHKIPCQGKHRKFGDFAKTQGKHRDFVCSSCKFPDPKGKGYYLPRKFQFFPKAVQVCQVSFVYVIVATYVNWHRENLRLNEEETGKTGNSKIQFEWVPCSYIFFGKKILFIRARVKGYNLIMYYDV